jgi:hypothetical protein
MNNEKRSKKKKKKTADNAESDTLADDWTEPNSFVLSLLAPTTNEKNDGRARMRTSWVFFYEILELT